MITELVALTKRFGVVAELVTDIVVLICFITQKMLVVGVVMTTCTVARQVKAVLPMYTVHSVVLLVAVGPVSINLVLSQTVDSVALEVTLLDILERFVPHTVLRAANSLDPVPRHNGPDDPGNVLAHVTRLAIRRLRAMG